MLSQNTMQDEVKPSETTISGSKFHIKSLWEHDLRGFLGEAVLFYPFWHKTAPKACGEALLNGP
jgi:hypothetical protein